MILIIAVISIFCYKNKKKKQKTNDKNKPAIPPMTMRITSLTNDSNIGLKITPADTDHFDKQTLDNEKNRNENKKKSLPQAVAMISAKEDKNNKEKNKNNDGNVQLSPVTDKGHGHFGEIIQKNKQNENSVSDKSVEEIEKHVITEKDKQTELYIFLKSLNINDYFLQFKMKQITFNILKSCDRNDIKFCAVCVWVFACVFRCFFFCSVLVCFVLFVCFFIGKKKNKNVIDKIGTYWMRLD